MNMLSPCDADLLVERQAVLDAVWPTVQQVGDFIDCADGVSVRVTHVWEDELVQVAPACSGSYYLGPCGGSYSGSLNRGAHPDRIKRSPGNERRAGRVWFFHNDYQGAGNGVDCSAMFRVWQYDGPSTDLLR